MARAALLSPMTRNPPRPVWPIRMPNGIPITAPIATAAAVYPRCWSRRSVIPPVSVQFSGFCR